MMPIVDVYARNKKHNVMQDTWGHLYPEPGSKHPGKVLIMHHGNSTALMDRNFSCEESPMEYELACSVMDMFDWADGLHEVSCTLWFYKSVSNMYLGSAIGRVIKAKVTTLYNTSNWGL